MKVIIAGSRNLAVSAYTLNHLMSMVGLKPTEIVSGGARGIDTCGEIWAAAHQLPLKRFPADWDRHGKAAGPLRNQEMAEYAEALLAFPGSGRGTWDMIERMKAEGKPVYVYDLGNSRWIEHW